MGVCDGRAAGIVRWRVYAVPFGGICALAARNTLAAFLPVDFEK